MEQIKDLLKSLNIKYKNITLYYESFTHKTFANEKNIKIDYQRLEFLGDAILEFLSSELIFQLYPNLSEGEMTILRSNSIKGDKLAEFAHELNLHKFIRFGKGKQDFKNNAKIHADIFESLVAAIYLDLGIEEVKTFLKNNIFKFIENSKGIEVKNPKTIIQEYLQSSKRGTIEYITKQNNKQFISSIYHDKNKFGTGIGNTKKESEVNAAENALKLLKLK